MKFTFKATTPVTVALSARGGVALANAILDAVRTMGAKGRKKSFTITITPPSVVTVTTE